MIKDKENHNGTLGKLKAIREKMKKELEEHFPWKHGDANELSNEISKN